MLIIYVRFYDYFLQDLLLIILYWKDICSRNKKEHIRVSISPADECVQKIGQNEAPRRTDP